MATDPAWKNFIIHVDMDAFYASVEQRDNPQLIGLPVIVGGNPRGRGVVTSASYQARKFGIHSAMPSSHAHRLCPGAIFIHPRFDAYREASRNIMAVFNEFTDLVEPMSLDEAYLDITSLVNEGNDPVDIAKEIIVRIKEVTSLNASAGISFNKFLAKVGSGINKPNGIKVITPQEAPKFLDDLPIRKFHGVGEATEKRMIERGIVKGSDLRKFSREELVSFFGRSGAFFHDIINLRYNSPVSTHHERRSIGKERTLHEDTTDMGEMMEKLTSIAEMLDSSMRVRKISGRTVTLRIKYHDHSRISRSASLPFAIRDCRTIIEIVKELISKTEAGKRRIRLLGISISNLEFEKNESSILIQTTLDKWFSSICCQPPSEALP
jgi:DNA polymerase-4